MCVPTRGCTHKNTSTCTHTKTVCVCVHKPRLTLLSAPAWPIDCGCADVGAAGVRTTNYVDAADAAGEYTTTLMLLLLLMLLVCTSLLMHTTSLMLLVCTHHHVDASCSYLHKHLKHNITNKHRQDKATHTHTQSHNQTQTHLHLKEHKR